MVCKHLDDNFKQCIGNCSTVLCRNFNLSCLVGVNQDVNIVFAFDTSDGITAADLDKIKSFAKASLLSYDISKDGINAGIVTFSNETDSVHVFSDDQTIHSLTIAIESINKRNGKADFKNVVKYLTSNMFSNIPSTQNKVLVLFTKGSSINGKQLVDLKNQLPGVKTVVVSIGDYKDIFGNFDMKIIKQNGGSLPKALNELEKAVDILTGNFTV